MAVRTLDTIFNPRRIALIGVTQNPNSVGGKVLANLVGGGFRGVAYPVNPEAEAVLGVPCFPDISSLPKVPDLAVICSPAAQVPDTVRQCGKAGIKGLIILSAGFREAGEEGLELERSVAAEAAGFDDMRIIECRDHGICFQQTSMSASPPTPRQRGMWPSSLNPEHSAHRYSTGRLRKKSDFPISYPWETCWMWTTET